jgi:hypothetical protein
MIPKGRCYYLSSPLLYTSTPILIVAVDATEALTIIADKNTLVATFTFSAA